ncbi:DUF488 domain-containing protein [Paenibacillus woosongensis]|uniref:DUF488 domain-containing protein n=1 Tax=Paenibacillus woosongensis TaxID=307580 RepID=A0AA95I5U0_9BACL|nr:DUF488 domain-containing protein [Paenibacillus woosongensis]WHX48214.1 DUF488 domain-containing protein [Paenibacillus woosongensis]
MLKIKRIYENPAFEDGKRILVDRIWPRGISEAEAQLDLWMKEVAPSTGLRKWFAHKPERYAEFSKRYEQELAAQEVKVYVEQLRSWMESETVTLLYAAKDQKHNHALVLQGVLERK